MHIKWLQCSEWLNGLQKCFNLYSLRCYQNAFHWFVSGLRNGTKHISKSSLEFTAEIFSVFSLVRACYCTKLLLQQGHNIHNWEHLSIFLGVSWWEHSYSYIHRGKTEYANGRPFRFLRCYLKYRSLSKKKVKTLLLLHLSQHNVGSFKFRSTYVLEGHKGNVLYSAGSLYGGSRSQTATVLGFSLTQGRRVCF